MEKLTAIFLDVLGKETGQESRVAALAKEIIQEEFSAKTEKLMAEGTLFFSREAIELHGELVALSNDISTLIYAGQAVDICRKLSVLCRQSDKLHSETQNQLHKAGHIDIGKLHFFYPEEQLDALGILEEYIKIELYRILSLRGGKVFLSVKPIRAYQHTLQDRMKYLIEQISPQVDNQEMKLLSTPHYWAVLHKTERKAGPLGTLPGYEVIEPIKTDYRFLPGEHKELPYRQETILQGVGCLTNVTPATVDKAQYEEKLHTEVTPDLLEKYTDHFEEPDIILKTIFSGSYYAIDAVNYFSVASYVEAVTAISRRRKLGQCLLCGKGASGEFFCAQCARRIRII